TTASSGGNISATGGATITANGVCWSTSTNPNVAGSHTTDTAVQSGAFTSSLTGLTAGTTYYVRAYATNSAGTAYGSQVSFTTALPALPTLTATTTATNITATGATSGSTVSSDGGATITAQGVCYATSTQTPTTSNGVAAVATIVQSGAFTASLTGLNPGSLYYVRAYSTNSAGTAYGYQTSFVTATSIPTIDSTTAASAITATTATTGGVISSSGGLTMTGEGVCYATTTAPTVANSKAVANSITAAGPWTSSLTGLTPSTTYYLRAYASNSMGTAYGPEVSFTTTAPSAPILSATTAASSITGSSATSGGTVTIPNGAPITAQGVCYATSTGPTTSNSVAAAVSIVQSGTFTSSLTGLTGGTTYYVRAYATNSTGTGYGPEVSFTTSAGVPVVTTTTATSIAATTATSGGGISATGGATITANGVCWSTTSGPTVLLSTKTSDTAVQSGGFSSSLTGLAPSTTYYLRAYATNSVGTAYGPEVTFTTTAPTVATLSTRAVYGINSYSATSGGSIINTGGANLTANGICWSTSTGPTVALSTKTADTVVQSGSFVSALTGLTANTTYYVRAYATNGPGIAYGNEVTFTTPGAVAPIMNSTGGGTVGDTSVTSGGGVFSNGGATITAEGLCYSTSPNPSISSPTAPADTLVQAGPFTVLMTGLTPGTQYYIRSYATNSAGTGYGLEATVVTLLARPTLTTSAISAITATTATCGGTISSPGGYPVTFNGICWSTSSGPTVALSTKTSDFAIQSGAFTSSLTGLTPLTTYYVRGYATNSAGTAYGAEVSLTTLAQVPTLSTTAASAITATTATSGGNVSTNGGGTITAQGVCYATTTAPTTSNSVAAAAAIVQSGAFTSSLTGLAGSTTYYVRAYATNSSGTAYGTQVSFTTSAATQSTLSTTSATAISATTATSGGNVSSNGGGTITAQGVCYATNTQTPTTSNSVAPATAIVQSGAFTSNLTGLTPGTIYWTRAYATNSAGTVYGNFVGFSTLASPPTVTTTAISALTGTTATTGGTISATGGAAITANGVCWGTAANPSLTGSHTTDTTVQSGAFSSNLTGLTTGTTYHVRAYATNSAGTAYGSDVTFTPVNAVTLSYTGAAQTWTVPSGVNRVVINCYGAAGGAGSGGSVGYGGHAQGTLAVSGGQVLNIYVGGAGGSLNGSTFSGGYNNTGAGWNGGGVPAVGSYPAAAGNIGGGGGASDVRIGGTALSNRIIVAGGAGGGPGDMHAIGVAGGYGTGWTNPTGSSGGGGGTSGDTASPSSIGAAATGGTSSGGGNGGGGGGTMIGTLGQGGYYIGNVGTTFAAGGGGGYWGGSAGAYSGGGGGSGYLHPTSIISGSMQNNINGGNGYVTITW
ncbi:MAG: hypothetical protein WCK63_15990, partial [Betaproteobacteria bacterium]